MTFTEPEACRLCNNTDRRDLRYALVHWRDAPLGMAYEHVARCLDRAACRARLTSRGAEWPLTESNERRTA